MTRSPKTDVFGLATVIFELYTGVPLFDPKVCTSSEAEHLWYMERRTQTHFDSAFIKLYLLRHAALPKWLDNYGLNMSNVDIEDENLPILEKLDPITVSFSSKVHLVHGSLFLLRGCCTRIHFSAISSAICLCSRCRSGQQQDFS